MASNIIKPSWLNDSVIAKLRNDIAICPNPYTKEEVNGIELDGAFDVKRLNAYEAINTLNHYGIPLTYD